MSKVSFQIMGGFGILAAIGLLVGGLLTMLHYPPRSFWEGVPLFAVVVGLLVSGVGLLYLRKWAALIFSAMALYVATWEVKDALHPIPGYASWLGFIFAILLAGPSVLTVVNWRTLIWRRR